jgi:hypothetical protein
MMRAKQSARCELSQGIERALNPSVPSGQAMRRMFSPIDAEEDVPFLSGWVGTQSTTSDHDTMRVTIHP